MNTELTNISPGKRFRDAVAQETPLQVIGTINAYCALMAEQVGFRALYLSGAGVANAAYGLPDLAMTSLSEVVEEASRITAASSLPLLVDIDTGWGGVFNIARTIRQMVRAGVAAVHIEDQVEQKRCGHRPNKAVVSCEEMCDRIKAAVDAKPDSDFVVMARTDALAVEGKVAMLDRISAYEAVGADMIFAEAMMTLDDYREVTERVSVPVLANLTEFGVTPLFTCGQLASAKIQLALYPLSAFRAMNAAALNVFKTLREQGTQASVVDSMQTRKELYEFLDYPRYEEKLDQLFNHR